MNDRELFEAWWDRQWRQLGFTEAETTRLQPVAWYAWEACAAAKHVEIVRLRAVLERAVALMREWRESDRQVENGAPI